MSELKYPNTPLQKLKNKIESRLSIMKYRNYTEGTKLNFEYILNVVLNDIKELEAEDQRQARDAENWSWRNGDDMGR